ncbi:MNIO family bufferin maturase [Marinobacterium arenosum]|uniref:MNIO family bufferin maturase n=1 Tax=Marinobacterium arenosum TaxID=2862496 RepID=UPI001C96EF91|nr:DUF692 domain-containing protein [Marinobacterium arenosum]MBY4678074.1 DUF692 domain-containing protein [Marinobacterium arenosum]
MTRQSIEGVGLGLRSCHYQTILAEQPAIPWFEAMTDNYLGDGGQPHYYLSRIRNDYPITFHGVGLSLGSARPLSEAYLDRLVTLVERYQPAWISEHLCWCASAEHNSHDLLPLPYNELAVRHLSERIDQVQNRLGRRILVENLSSYVAFAESEMSEWQYVAEICRRADCELLLDVNNIYVSACNQGFDPQDYLAGIPVERVREIHLAGYQLQGELLLDSHSQPVHPPVWQLYRDALCRFGQVPTLIEWDNDIPPFDRLWQEAQRAERLREEVAVDG